MDEEIAHFVQLKAGQAARMGNIRNLMGFLLTAVPRSLKGNGLANYRNERDCGSESLQEHGQRIDKIVAEMRRTLEDPNASEAEKRYARRYFEKEN